MLARQHGLAVLVADIDLLGDDAVACALGMIALVVARPDRRDRVADMHRADDAQPVVTLRHRVRFYRGCDEAVADREDHRSLHDSMAVSLLTDTAGLHKIPAEID